MSIRNEIEEIIKAEASKRAPLMVASALEKLAIEKRSGGDALVANVIAITAVWVRKHGPEATEEMVDKLIDALDGNDPNAIHNLQDVDALALSMLVEAYQAAEADDLRKAKKWARKLGAVMREVAQIAGQALIGALA
jgi:predicted nucleic-acid-binding protein